MRLAILMLAVEERIRAYEAWRDKNRIQLKLRSIPALLACVCAATLAAICIFHDPRTVQAHYLQAADRALDLEHFSKSLFLTQRLLRMDGGDRDANILRLARSLAGLDKPELALLAIAPLVPYNRPGVVQARLFVAETVLDRMADNTNTLVLAEKQLRKVLASTPDSIEARFLLARRYYLGEDFASAKAQFESVCKAKPESALWLSLIATTLNRPAEAIRWAEQAAQYFKAATEQAPSDWKARVKWAEASLLLGRPEEAIRIVETGVHEQGHRVYHRFAAQIYADQALRLARATPERTFARLATVRNGLQHEPENPVLVRQLIRLASEGGEESAAASRAVNDMVRRRPRDPALAFYRGMDAWEHGDFVTARACLSDAHAWDPNNAVVANNLAYLMAVSAPPDLPYALKLIDSALLDYPSSAVFRETRSQILAKMERFREAIEDLEFASIQLTNSPAIRKSLLHFKEHLAQQQKEQMELKEKSARTMRDARTNRMPARTTP